VKQAASSQPIHFQMRIQSQKFKKLQSKKFQQKFFLKILKRKSHQAQQAASSQPTKFNSLSDENPI